MVPMDVLVTGGAGYIGSTICSALADRGDRPIIIDSLLTGKREFCRDFPFYQGDISNQNLLLRIREDFPSCQTVIHCAARIVVGESVVDPYLYYKENLVKSIEFLRNAIELGFDKIIFSSSASVYGNVRSRIVHEATPCKPASPYAYTKLATENVLESYCDAYNAKALCLRYFNPIGADPQLRTGQIVENPTHLLGRLLETLTGKSPMFEVFGYDWETEDGTAIRDFIHVWDLALAHLAGIDHLVGLADQKAFDIINIGTGKGTTVKQFVDCFQAISPERVEVKHSSRRDGDVVGAYANVDKAEKILHWKSKRSIEDGIRDSLNWMFLRQRRMNKDLPWEPQDQINS
jgi:UDP-glucose 4-epimerase